ncbi:MAG TPA: hypothetical protein VGB87_02100 [Vicinamibacteria bacterium]
MTPLWVYRGRGCGGRWRLGAAGELGPQKEHLIQGVGCFHRDALVGFRCARDTQPPPPP